MSIEINTRDCAVLSDSELSVMADLSEAAGSSFDIGCLSKAREEWVLVTDVRKDDKLTGYAFYTLERIGGTPAIVVGIMLAESGPNSRETMLAIREGQFRKALLAFPDEDVLVGTRLTDQGGFEIFEGLVDIVPQPGHKPSGEERAWARRLARRFGGEHRIDDRSFVLTGTGETIGYTAYVPPAPSAQLAGFGDLFVGLDAERRDSLIALGWIMAEELAKYSGFDD